MRFRSEPSVEQRIGLIDRWSSVPTRRKRHGQIAMKNSSAQTRRSWRAKREELTEWNCALGEACRTSA